jgi:hypothetical protein
VYQFNYGYGNSDGDGQKKHQFKGALSIGVDDVSNTLVVSAAPYLMSEVSMLIEYLDEAAKPSTTVQVLNVGGGLSASGLKQALSNILPTTEGTPGAKPGGPEPGSPDRRGRRFDRNAEPEPEEPFEP